MESVEDHGSAARLFITEALTLGVLAAEVRAAQRDHTDIEVAAAHLHGMLDALM